MEMIKLYIVSFRPIVSLFSGLSCLSYLLFTKSVNVNHYISCLSFVLITGIGFVYNDIFDYEKDKLAGKKRPICTDKLSKENANFINIVLSIVTLIGTLLLTTLTQVLIVFISLIAVIYYSYFSKKFSILKGAYTAALCTSPLIYGQSLINYYNLSSIFLIFLFFLGRELLLDIYDFAGDKLSKRKTIPFHIGIRNSQILAWFFMFASGIIYLILSKSNIVDLVISLVCFMLLVVSFRFRNVEKKAVFYTRILILLVSLSIARI